MSVNKQLNHLFLLVNHFISNGSGSFILIFVCLFISINLPFTKVYAQQNTFYFDRFDTDNGLSTNHIHCVYQDKKGYIWLGTPLGLIRYNGYTFTEFKHREDDSASIGKGSVWAIHEDINSNLWIGTQGGGLNLFNRAHETFIHYYKQDEKGSSVNDNNINAITSDKFDNVWIGTGLGGLNCYNSKTKNFSYFKNKAGDSSSINNNSVMSVFVDNSDQLWIGTWGGGLNSFDYSSKKFTHYIFDSAIRANGTSNAVWTIYEDKKDNLWLGTWGSGLILFERTSKKFNRYIRNTSDGSGISDNVVLSLLEDNYGNFWVGTESGLNLMDRDNADFLIPDMRGTEPREDLSGSSVYSLLNDKQGILWIGTFGQGINLWDRNKLKFSLQKLDNDLKGHWVNCVYEDEDGMIWIGTGENGIVKYERKLHQFVNFKNENRRLDSKFVNKIYKLDDKNLLLTTFKGLYQLNRINGVISPFNLMKEALNPSVINVSNQYIIYNSNQSLIQYDIEQKQYSELLKTDTLSVITCFLLSGDSAIWIGTDISGVYKYNLRTQTLENFKYRNGSEISISDNSILDIFEDRKGNVWIGTAMGLNKFNPGNHDLQIYKEKDGLSNSTVSDIIEDDEGKLWISTLVGVSSFDPESGIFTNFIETDGLPGKTPGLYKTLDGSIILTGAKGFSIVNPSRITYNEFVPPVLITEFKLFNKPVLPGINGSPLKNHISETKVISLKYNQSFMTFSWVCLNYRFPEENQYAYKMEGFEKDWNYVGSTRTTTYTNLSPGHYIFRVKASNNDGLWNETGVSLEINILPPFWQTWWFILIILIFVFGSFYLWYRMRVWRLLAQKSILQEQVNLRTADINRQKEILQKQKEELIFQSDKLLDANFLLVTRGEELENSEKELRIQSAELSKANEELIRLNSTKDRLFSIIAHDLKNPFNAIIGYAEQLTENYDSLTSEKKKQMLGNILGSSKNAYKLLENLLDWARSQTNRVEFKPVTIHIKSVSVKVKKLLELQADTKNIEIEIDVPDTIHAYADMAMTETILRNLMSNAIKFTPSDGKIHVSASENRVGYFLEKNAGLYNTIFEKYPEAEYVELSVRDSGIGISPEDLDKLFRIDVPHFTPGTNDERGTGLGLILSREFAEKNFGKITVQSQVGKGSNFNLYIPKNRESIINIQKDKQKTHLKGPENIDFQITEKKQQYSALQKSQVLIVEDNPELRSYMVKNLSLNFQVEEARNGKEGLDKSFQIIPDLIVTDVMMPEMDGFELCKAIKADERTSHIPVVLLTAKISDEDHMAGLETGANDYLMKPFDIRLLTLKIRNMLEMQKELRDRYSAQVFISPSNLPISSIDEMFIKKAIEMVEKSMKDEHFNVEKFSDAMNLSHIQLYRKLHALANISPSDFIRTIRLKRAAQLLETGNLNVNEICYETGFNNHSYFTKCFKKEFGVLPKDYLLKRK